MFWFTDGCVLKLSWLAAPATMLNECAFDGAARPDELAASVYPVPDLVIAHPVKLATPALSVTVRPPVFVQLSTPPPGLLPIARVTDRPESPVTVLPS